MNYDKKYDETNPASIEAYAQKLIGKTFLDVCNEDNIDHKKIAKEIESISYIESHENKNRKGGLGELIEERFFHYQSNNSVEPDFEEAGVELKVTPYRVNKNGSIKAKERLIITMIDYHKAVEEVFEKSHLWKKAKLILLVFYLYQEDITSRLDYRIDHVKLFTPPEQDIKIIKRDFEYIVQKIKDGRAHELSESDTLYLGAATKAATSADMKRQPFSNEMAKPRAFSFKNSYMTYVLRNYIVSSKRAVESIISNEIVESFEDYVVNRINVYRGISIEELCKEFQIEFKNRPKSLEAMLVYRILGIKGNHAAEFEKANIVIKTIRIEKTNKIRESMSFPTFKFQEIVEEDWETSKICTYLNETRFLFVVYKFDEQGTLRLKGCQFWNIPYKDLHEEVRKVWAQTKKVLIEGLEFNLRSGRLYNNFPKMSDNNVCHVRPHARDSKDTYELPDGRQYPKQCFWLNNSYVFSQLKDLFGE